MAYEGVGDYNQDRWTADAVRQEADREAKLEDQRAAQAEAAGVRDARFIGYAEVLGVYNQRSDTETLASRRARHLAATPVEQDFTRDADWVGDKGPEGDAPQADTVYGSPADDGFAGGDAGGEGEGDQTEG